MLTVLLINKVKCMKRMKLIRLISLIVIGFSTVYSVKAQLSIEQCKQKAHENYPLIKRFDLIEKSATYDLSNAGKGHLPQIALNAKASYQTQVTEIPVSLPGLDIKSPNKDQYGITLDINQTVWDGGTIRSQKEIIKTTTTVERKQLEVDLYEIDERVNQLFFGILLLDARLEQNVLLQEELVRNYEKVAASVNNGVANQTDLDIIRIEQLNAKQANVQLKSNRKTYVEMLQILIGEPIQEHVIFQKPEIYEVSDQYQNNRPELTLFDARVENLVARQQMIRSGLMPKLGVFATGGYGNPALNMLKPEFSTYFIGGIKLTWNFGRFYTQKNEKRLIDINRQHIQTQRETFLFNTNLESVKQINEVDRQRQLLTLDDEKISLRQQVKRATEIKVENGMATITDLMDEITSADMAIQEKIQHEIELWLSVYQLKHITNN